MNGPSILNSYSQLPHVFKLQKKTRIDLETGNLPTLLLDTARPRSSHECRRYFTLQCTSRNRVAFACIPTIMIQSRFRGIPFSRSTAFVLRETGTDRGRGRTASSDSRGQLRYTHRIDAIKEEEKGSAHTYLPMLSCLISIAIEKCICSTFSSLS